MKKLYATEKLKQFRVDNDYSQLEICSLIAIEMDRDLSLSTYQKWESGALHLTPNNAKMLSRFTKIPIEDLVFGK